MYIEDMLKETINLQARLIGILEEHSKALVKITDRLDYLDVMIKELRDNKTP